MIKLESYEYLFSQSMNISIVGWHEGSAGLLDSWLNEIGVNVQSFIAIDDLHLKGPSTEYKAHENPYFSYPQKNKFKDKPLIYDPIWYMNSERFESDGFLISVTDNNERIKQIELAIQHRVNLISVKHPSVIVMEGATLGVNSILHAGVIVGYKVIINNGVIVNTASHIDHHSILRNGVSIDPGCSIAGNVTINEFVTVHTGSVIINKVTIGKNSIIGAGAVVVQNVEANSLMVGVPAKKKKTI